MVCGAADTCDAPAVALHRSRRAPAVPGVMLAPVPSTLARVNEPRRCLAVASLCDPARPCCVYRIALPPRRVVSAPRVSNAGWRQCRRELGGCRHHHGLDVLDAASRPPAADCTRVHRHRACTILVTDRACAAGCLCGQPAARGPSLHLSQPAGAATGMAPRSGCRRTAPGARGCSRRCSGAGACARVVLRRVVSAAGPQRAMVARFPRRRSGGVTCCRVVRL